MEINKLSQLLALLIEYIYFYLEKFSPFSNRVCECDCCIRNEAEKIKKI